MLVDRDGSLWIIRNYNVEHRWLGAPGDSSSPTSSGTLTEAASLSGAPGPLLQDREGHIWVGTLGGLDQFRATKLTSVAPAPMVFPALAPAPDGAVWIGSEEQPLMKVGAGAEVLPAVTSKIETIYREPDGVIWFGDAAGLWRLRAGKLQKVAMPEGTLQQKIQAITRDGGGDLWLSVIRRGVYQLTGGRWIPFGDRAELPREPAWVMRTDRTGRTWFGYMRSRLALVHADTTRLYTHADGLDVGNVRAICPHGDGIWIGGEAGLVLFDGRRFHPIGRSDGSPFRGVTGVLERATGELWLQTADGIVRIPAAEIPRGAINSSVAVRYDLLDSRDGLVGAGQDIRPQPNIIEGTDGRLWFATASQVTWLDPDAVPRNPLPPPVVIRGLRAGGHRYPASGQVVLPVHTTRVTLDYSALSLGIPERVRFRYRLVGIGEPWQTDGNRGASYNNLDPGSYRFEVTAANEDGVWNTTGASLSFVIPPSVTQSRWFLAVWIFLFGALAWLAYLLRMRQVAHALRTRFEVALAERSRIGQELHDTLLQGFAGVTLQLKAAQLALPEQPDVAAETLARVQRLAGEALREARESVWDMRAPELDEGDLAEVLQASAEAATTGTDTEVRVTTGGRRRRLPRAAEVVAFRIGREAIANTVQHAAARVLEIELDFGATMLNLEVRDDGLGLTDGTPTTRSGHFGISGMRERARRAGGTLEVRSRLEGGTVVTLQLPVADGDSGKPSRSA